MLKKVYMDSSRNCVSWKRIDRLLISAGFHQGKIKGSSSQLICNAHIMFLPCAACCIMYSSYSKSNCMLHVCKHTMYRMLIIFHLYTPCTLRECCSQSDSRILKIRTSSVRLLFLYNCTPNTLRAYERSIGCIHMPIGIIYLLFE